MMYDFHGVWEETSLVNHHSSLYSSDNLNVVSSTENVYLNYVQVIRNICNSKYVTNEYKMVFR